MGNSHQKEEAQHKSCISEHINKKGWMLKMSTVNS